LREQLWIGFTIGTGGPTVTVEYRPGACNIGPEEIARRRSAGLGGIVATVVLLAGLLAMGAPPFARLLVALPATAAAAGYIQAWLKFCIAFGSRGIFNFGPLGQVERIERVPGGPHAGARDRSRAVQIGLVSLGIGIGVGIAAVLLPV